MSCFRGQHSELAEHFWVFVFIYILSLYRYYTFRKAGWYNSSARHSDIESIDSEEFINLHGLKDHHNILTLLVSRPENSCNQILHLLKFLRPSRTVVQTIPIPYW